MLPPISTTRSRHTYDRGAVGIDLRFHTSVADQIAKVIVDILSTVRSQILPERQDRSVRLETVLCLHPMDASLPLLLDDNTRSIMRSAGVTLLHPLHATPEAFCGERLLQRHYRPRKHGSDEQIADSDHEQLAVSVLDEVLEEHPRWKTPSPVAPHVTLLDQVTVFLVQPLDATTLMLSRADPDSHDEADVEDTLFAWRYLPAEGSSLNDSICAFHYPMDGITIYAGISEDGLLTSRLRMLSYIDPDLLWLDAKTSYLFTLQSIVFKLDFSYELTAENQGDISWVVAPAGCKDAVAPLTLLSLLSCRF